MINGLSTQQFATHLQYDSLNQLYQSNEARLRLANQPLFQASPQTQLSIHEQDKALELQGIQAKTMYEISQVMAEAARSRQKKEVERRRQAIENGFLF